MLFRLLAVSDRASLGEEHLNRWLGQLAAAGVDGLMLREKDLDDRALYGLARLARSLFPPPARLLVNGRLDVALAAGADGVHLPADGVPVAPLRQRFGPRPLLGRSTHRVEEVVAAREAGADYVTFGPVYPTPGKERYGAPPGLGGLARAAAAGIPVYALGGVTLERLDEVAAAGAAGAAGIRLFQEVSRLPELMRAATLAFPRLPIRPYPPAQIPSPGAARREP
ncbi:MAG: thiamine-phosphate pyrophosphorylase [Acidobacteriota bacterium]|nr:thiamine-phosphate pyrophosphorylase [Acidobacteriota bacterium]